MTAFVVVLIGVWVAGFFWVRGDFAEPTTTSVQTRKAAAAAQPSAASSPTTTPTESAAATPSASGGDDPSSPSSKLAGKVSKLAKLDRGDPIEGRSDALRPRPELLPPVAEFKMASFNILGSSHTRKGGHSAGRASGTQRMGGVLQLLAANAISVVGIQEFQPDQRQAFSSRAGGWSMYPGLSLGQRAGENSVAWRNDVWEPVERNLVNIPYFNGRQRPMPYVKLRHRATGITAWFSTFHNPADTGNFRGQQRYRTEATSREIALFNRLEGTGVPQFVTGDMNERAEYFCRVTGGTRLVAAAGGSNSGGCRPPSPTQIDWIFGSPGASFSGYAAIRNDLVRRTTDHPLVVVSVSIDGLKYAPRGSGSRAAERPAARR